MVTRDNIEEVLNQSLTIEEIQNALNDGGDYIMLELHIFNAGGFATVESLDYCEDAEQDAYGSGNLFCDKDSFVALCNEVGVNI